MLQELAVKCAAGDEEATFIKGTEGAMSRLKRAAMSPILIGDKQDDKFTKVVLRCARAGIVGANRKFALEDWFWFNYLPKVIINGIQLADKVSLGKAEEAYRRNLKEVLSISL